MLKFKIPHAMDYYHIHIILLLLFLYGYFQRTSPGKSNPPNILDDSDHINLTTEALSGPKYDRLVFVVIDALREDFVTEILMPYTFKSASNDDCLFQVKVAAPTVTLPRIKTLTMGIVPQYFDMITNLWVSQSDRNSWNNSILHSAKNNGKRMVFYGDDTWLHLYPDVFQRSEGTNSMFVNDFFEVDNNVTSNVRLELLRNDWDFMFLHYLGLDHIGHVEGPKSNLVPNKLLEMDLIIELLHRSLMHKTDTSASTLILVTGDHGMRDSGGHGGTSYAETHVPLVLLGMPCSTHNKEIAKDMDVLDQDILLKLSKLHRSNVQQSDIPTSLALLYGLDVPPDSIGKFVPEFYGGLSLKQRYYYCLYNHKILFSNFPTESLKKLNWTILSDCETSLIKATNKLSEDESGGHILLLLSCTFLQIILVVNAITALNHSSCLILDSVDIAVVFIYLLLLDKIPFHLSLAILIIIIFKFLLSSKFCFIKEYRNSYFTTFLIMFSHSFLLLCSTSYVEEEHQVYYYFFVTALLLINYHNFANSKHTNIFTDALLLITFRFIKCLNQTGDQFASRPDVIDWFLQSQNYSYSLLFLISSFIFIILVSKDFFKDHLFHYIAFTALLSNIFIYKLFYYNIIYYAQLLWIFIFLLAIVNYVNSARNCDNAPTFWICISCLVSRTHNLMLIPFTIIMSSYICCRIGKNSSHQIILHMILGQTMFFCSGFSNSLASVDVASGYVGIKSYDPILVTIIVLCNTYCLPILSQMLLLRNCDFSVKQVLLAHVIDRMLTLTFVCIAAVIHIQHLFVWSVFAPKLLIESCHSIILWICLVSYKLCMWINK